MIGHIDNISFKGYTPVRIFIKDSINNTYYPTAKDSIVKKCNGCLVRNLNGSLKNVNKKFVDYYSSYDKDYKENPFVRSFYDSYAGNTNTYLVSGDDAYRLDEFARPVGIAKSNSKRYFNHSNSYDSKLEAQAYFSKSRDYIQNCCSRVKDANRIPLVLNGYFEAKYNKKGELIKCEFKGANFTTKHDNNPQENPNLEMKPQEPTYRQMTIFDYLG